MPVYDGQAGEGASAPLSAGISAALTPTNSAAPVEAGPQADLKMRVMIQKLNINRSGIEATEMEETGK